MLLRTSCQTQRSARPRGRRQPAAPHKDPRLRTKIRVARSPRRARAPRRCVHARPDGAPLRPDAAYHGSATTLRRLQFKPSRRRGARGPGPHPASRNPRSGPSRPAPTDGRLKRIAPLSRRAPGAGLAPRGTKAGPVTTRRAPGPGRPAPRGRHGGMPACGGGAAGGPGGGRAGPGAWPCCPGAVSPGRGRGGGGWGRCPRTRGGGRHGGRGAGVCDTVVLSFVVFERVLRETGQPL